MASLPPDNLTSEEEKKLQQAWIHLLRLSGDKNLEKTASSSAVPDITNHLRQHYFNNKPLEDFRKGLWSSVLFEHPDTLVVRFLRARKWDVAKAMEMLVSAVHWRIERDMSETIIRRGDSVGLKADPTEDERGFMAQYRSGKSFVHGVDRKNLTVYVIRVVLHDPRAQSAEVMENYILHNIESLRLVAKPPYDKCCLLFDMTGFGLKNMDFHIVRFLISVFEARYPETLSAALIHNAPFVFWGIWNVIKGWLDPVIASKIHFTRKPADLAQFIAESNLQTCHGGTDAWEYAYVEPKTGENARLDDAEKRAEIENERDDLLREFEVETAEWAVSAGGNGARRSDVAARLGANYWKLDPYVRARTLLHRTGIISEA